MESSQSTKAATASATDTTSAKEDSSSVVAHNDVTLALAKRESAEHLQGMKELYEIMRQRPLQVKAYASNDPNAPPPSSCCSDSNDCNGKNSSVKTIHFVRHGQAFHNLMADQAVAAGRTWKQFCPNDTNNPYIMPELLDAPLTEKGRQQAILLQQKVKAFEKDDANSTTKLQLVVTSPNCRAVQTSLLVFQQYLLTRQLHCLDESGPTPNSSSIIPFLAHELVREQHGIHVCDQRRSISQLAMEFPHVDFTLIPDDPDLLHRNDVRESKLKLGNRIYDFLLWLSTRPEQNIGIVSHSSWLLALFHAVLDCSSTSDCGSSSSSENDCESSSSSNPLQEWFQTGEMRSVKLEFIMTPPNKLLLEHT
jgi:broad specificity phosphatase PhoE